MKSKAPRVIAELMTPCPIAASPRQSLSDANSLMLSLGVRHLPVVEERRLIGVISQGDLRLFASLGKGEPSRIQVEEAMIPCPYAVTPDEPIAAVLAHMLKRRIGSALVVERGRLVGIFTAVDAIGCLRRLLEEADDPDAGAAVLPAEAGSRAA